MLLKCGREVFDIEAHYSLYIPGSRGRMTWVTRVIEIFDRQATLFSGPVALVNMFSKDWVLLLRFKRDEHLGARQSCSVCDLKRLVPKLASLLGGHKVHVA